MAQLYTKNGVPLRVDRDAVFNPSGKQIGRIKGEKVYGPTGKYLGTIVGDRLVYRSTQSAGVSSPFAPRIRAGSAAAHRAASALWGEEPNVS